MVRQATEILRRKRSIPTVRDFSGVLSRGFDETDANAADLVFGPFGIGTFIHSLVLEVSGNTAGMSILFAARFMSVPADDDTEFALGRTILLPTEGLAGHVRFFIGVGHTMISFAVFQRVEHASPFVQCQVVPDGGRTAGVVNLLGGA